MSALAIVALFALVDACSSRDPGSPDVGQSLGGSGGTNLANGGIGGQIGGGQNGGAGGQSAGGRNGGTPAGGVGGASSSAGAGGTQNNCLSGGATGGTAAGAGETGSSGRSGTTCCRAPSSCIEGLCGNGVRDACTAPSGTGSCPVYSFAETCDGDDLGGETCTSMGYGSGALVCSSACGFDTTGCYTCAAGSPAVARCNVVPSTSYSPPSMAATDTQTALVWIDESDGASMQVGFALLSSSLDVISTGHIADAAIAAVSTDGPTAQIAALPSGWLVLASTHSSISLYTLDVAGNVVASSFLDPMSGGFEISAILVSQPNGGPLVIWEGISTYAAVVSADGRSVTTPIEVPVDSYDGGGVLPSLTSAAFAAGAFQAVFNENCATGPCVQIVSIALDGTVAGSFQPLGLTAPWGARFVSGADDLRLLYETDCGTTLSDPCLMWQRLSSTGEALSSSVLIDGSATSGLPDSAVALGADSYLSSGGPYWSSMMLHLAADGTVAGGPTVIAQGDSAGAVIVRQGSNLVAGWSENEPSHIEVAKLAP